MLEKRAPTKRWLFTRIILNLILILWECLNESLLRILRYCWNHQDHSGGIAQLQRNSGLAPSLLLEQLHS
jgi:hypothetical protein